MKKTFKKFLLENQTPFYSLYNLEFPSEKVKKMKGKDKEKLLDAEQDLYNETLAKFLRINSAIN